MNIPFVSLIQIKITIAAVAVAGGGDYCWYQHWRHPHTHRAVHWKRYFSHHFCCLMNAYNRIAQKKTQWNQQNESKWLCAMYKNVDNTK